MNDKWIDRARQSLEHSARDLNAHHASTLNRARQRALAEIDRPRLAARGWTLALATLLLVVLVGGVWLRAPDPPQAPPAEASTPLADLDVLSAEEDLDLLADLEFYLWLEESWPEDAG